MQTPPRFRGTASLVATMLGIALASGLFGCGTNTATNIGTISTIAGTGAYGYSGDGGPATAAQLNQPTCAVLDSAGNLFISDVVTNTVRKVAAGTGMISTYAGNGVAAYSGDGGPATAASMYGPAGCALDGSGNLYVADIANNAIRKITASTGIITTVAGNGFGAGGIAAGGFSGDGGPATKAQISAPLGIAVDASGNLFISDTGNHRVREVNSATGIITTIAGNGSLGYSGDNGPATAAMLGEPAQLAVDASGHLYFADLNNGVIEKVTLSTGTINTVAGNGAEFDERTVVGDGGPATRAPLAVPVGVALDAAGNLLISDTDHQRVREVAASTGIITTVVGTTVGYSGDGGPALSAQLNNPEGLFFDAAGNLYIADSYNSVIRKVTPGH